MPNTLKALLACTRRVRPQIYAPKPQNDNDHPDSPASALALRPHRAGDEVTAIGTVDGRLQRHWA